MNFYEDANKVGKEAMDNSLRSFSAMTKGFQKIASESTDFAKQNYEQSAQMVEKLSQVKSLDRAFEVQAEFAKSAYERWMSQASKMSEMCTDIAKETYQPLEKTMASAVNKGQSAAREM